jgi:DNA polymerase IV
MKTERRKSYSMDRTLSADTFDRGFLRAVACEIGECLAGKLRSDGRGASTVTLKVRYWDFSQASRSVTLNQPVNSTREILTCVARLFEKTAVPGRSVRQVGVKLSGLDDPAVQMDLFDPARPRLREMDRAVDTIRRRFGFGAVLPARGSDGSRVS